jgi:ABC-type sugar transport system substrate-binding protein
MKKTARIDVRRQRRTPRSSAGRIAALLVAAIALFVVACGGGSGSGASGSGSGSATAASAAALPKTGCGSVPPAKTADPDGVVAKLPPEQRAAYPGYAPAALKSAWANWKPTHAPPYKIGIVWGPVVNTYQTDMVRDMQAGLKKSSIIGDVTVRTTGSETDIGQELQAASSLLTSGVDVLIIQPLLGDSFIRLAQRARAQGVPIVTALGPINDPGALNLDYNAYLGSAEATARVARALGGKGSVLYGVGIPSTGVDVYSAEGFNAALKQCPGMKLLGKIYSGFVSSVAKGETVKFLATHPQKVNMVFASGPFVPGMMQAFQSTGRPVPPAVDMGGTKGAMGYWRQNKGAYQGLAMGVPSTGYANAVVSTTLRTLEGQGPLTNDLVTKAVLVTDDNLDAWSDPAWTLQTIGQPDGPAGAFFPESYLNGFFTSGATPK